MENENSTREILFPQQTSLLAHAGSDTPANYRYKNGLAAVARRSSASPCTGVCSHSSCSPHHKRYMFENRPCLS